MAPSRSVSREQVIAHRVAVHGLGDPRSAATALEVGAQDHPAGRSAGLALDLRGGGDDHALAHTVRAAMHAHSTADLGVYAAALRIDDGADLARANIGPFGREIEEAGLGFGAAMDDVAAAMREVMADDCRRTKGELSGAVTPLVDERAAPWCGGCGVHHVHDALFRYATLQAGLTIEVESPKVFRFRPPVRLVAGETAPARAELVRRFVRACGVARPAQVAAWLSLEPAAARGWWDAIADEVVPVRVGDRSGWAHAADADAFAGALEPPAVRLLGPYDPFLETADREFVVPEKAYRRAVWSAVANPGVLLVRGEVAGTWRQRTSRSGSGGTTITVTPFGRLPAGALDDAHADAVVVASYGAGEVKLEQAS